MANDRISAVGTNIAEKATMIWNVADMLRGPFKPHEYGLVIDPAAYQVSVDGIPLSPDKRGFQLLCLLAEVPGKVYTYAEIAERLYPEDQDPESRVQRVQAAKNDLSKHLKSLGITRRPVKSKSGIGYYLDKDQASPNRRFS